MVNLTLNGKSYNCPTCYEEITTRQWQRIITEWDIDKDVAERDYFKLFSILTNSDFKSFHATSENEVTLWNYLSWFIESDFQFSKELPKALDINGKVILLPENVKSLSIGQNIVAKQSIEGSKTLVNDKGEPVEFSCYAKAAAIFLQPLYTGTKFDNKKVSELENILLDMPIYLIRPIGFFILANALKIGRPQKSHWLQTQINQIKSLKKRLLTSLKYRGLRLSMTLILLILTRLDTVKTLTMRYFLL